uniref:Uncharacterized protein n=1 Tax=Anguilla anguilla TaxID=7936 RepID=A0A0E9XND2_ANGAN
MREINKKSEGITTIKKQSMSRTNEKNILKKGQIKFLA